MARSKCPKCEHNHFEMVENSPTNSQYKLLFVQCSSCGAVVGTMDYDNIGTAIELLEKKVDDSVMNTNTAIASLNIVNENIASLFRLVKSGFQEIQEKGEINKPNS